jgi:hypothetical protein
LLTKPDTAHAPGSWTSPDIGSRHSPGHHRAAIDASLVLLGQERRSLLRCLDRARRFRNEALYGDVAPVGTDEFAQLTRDVTWLLEELEKAPM